MGDMGEESNVEFYGQGKEVTLKHSLMVNILTSIQGFWLHTGRSPTGRCQRSILNTV